MSGKLLKEIHKSKPFDTPRQEAFLNAVRTADHLMRRFEDLLKPYSLSAVQYNVLRILRGLTTGTAVGGSGEAKGSKAASAGVPCGVIAEHMLTRDPDITRLLDRLEARGLILRQRESRDRRIVSTRITPDALAMLKELDSPVAAFHAEQFPKMSEAELKRFIDLLEKARG